jgi:hypothetical protein
MRFSFQGPDYKAEDGYFLNCTERMTSMSHLIQTGLWRWLKATGLERFELFRNSEEWVLRGTILLSAAGGSAETRYEVVCDDSWNTRRADISFRDEAGERALKVAFEKGQWYVNGLKDNSLTGCKDIDLEWSPSTNTLPIRRLSLAIGEKSGPVTAAWVRFPGLTIEPLSQQYERTADQRYRYTSRGGEFVAELAVDEEGLVQDYEGIWQRALKNVDQ